MLKLTLTTGNATYIRASAIISLTPLGDATSVIFRHGSCFVKETPEEIMAMPEMLTDLYPPYMLRGSISDGDLTPLVKY